MEWIETDGRGGFAMGEASGIPSRRYHTLLTAAVGSPANRFNLVNSVHVELTCRGGSSIISSFKFAPGTVASEGVEAMRSFTYRPWPTWHFSTAGGEIRQELLISRAPCLTMLRWSAQDHCPGGILRVRPLISCRFYHALHSENASFNFAPHTLGNALLFQPYESNPGIVTLSNGEFSAWPHWFRGVWYQEDKERGGDYLEDLAAPGVFEFDLTKGPAVLLLGSSTYDINQVTDRRAVDLFVDLQARERARRDAYSDRLEYSADDFLVERAGRKSIIAGYPWFADWGRDTFISMRGLTLATRRLSDAQEILIQWTEVISQGMLPNRFMEHGEDPEYNSVDASLWFVVACYEFLRLAEESGFKLIGSVHDRLLSAIDTIVSHFMAGTRYNIKCDLEDGLLAAGEKGVQLTWMDAKIGDYVVTPRIGKPVEIQALWITALLACDQLLGKHGALATQARNSFKIKFWNEKTQCLFDVIDVNHQKGVNDPTIRPNQIFAVGGLPLMLLDHARAKVVVDTVERELLTPHGLRTLSATDPAYRGHYRGGPYDRDTAYHQGTVWPWLLGPFVEAWVRVNGNNTTARRRARARFLDPVLATLDEAGLGHISEINDGDLPHAHRGCPFQAWSICEALRLQRQVLTA